MPLVKRSIQRQTPYRLAILIVPALVVVALGTLFYFSSQKVTVTEHAKLLKEADNYAAKGEYLKEAEALAEVLKNNLPAEMESVDMLRQASAYGNAKHYDKAESSYKRVIGEYPDSEFAATRGLAIMYMKKGEAEKNMDDLAKALQYFERVKELGSQDERYTNLATSDDVNIRRIKQMLGK